MTEHSIPILTPRGSGTRCTSSFLQGCADAVSGELPRHTLGEIVFRTLEGGARPISKRRLAFDTVRRGGLAGTSTNDRLYIIIVSDNLCTRPILYLLTSTNWARRCASGSRCSVFSMPVAERMRRDGKYQPTIETFRQP